MSVPPARAARILERARLDFSSIQDPRDARGRRFELPGLLRQMLLGLATLSSSCRGFEAVGERLSPRVLRRLGLAKTASDTSLYELLARLSPEGFREVCFEMVRRDVRSHAIRNDLFPVGVLTVDGKGCGGGRGSVTDAAVRKNVFDKKGSACWDLYALRASLTSSSARPLLDQEFVRSNQHETKAFPALWARMCANFGRLFSLVTLDAGFTSAANAQLIVASGKDYLIALKAQNKRRFLLAEEALASRPVAARTVERAQGNLNTRELRRAKAPVDFRFPGAVEVWSVCRTAEGSQEREVENRIFIVSELAAKLSDEHALALVRQHWGIENGPNWTLDVMMGEDTGAPCTAGNALSVISWLRVLAYNLLSVFRAHLPAKDRKPRSWEFAAQMLREAFIYFHFLLPTPDPVRSG